MNTSMTARNGFSLLSVLSWILAMIVAIAVEVTAGSAIAATFTVVSNADTEGTCGTVLPLGFPPRVSQPCTLRAAIEQVNAHPTAASAPHVITFNIGFGPKTIALTKDLPHIAQPVIIDGTTQRALKVVNGSSLIFSCAQLYVHPCITLSGSSGVAMDGLTLIGGNTTVRGLDVIDFNGNGISIQSSNNTVERNYIGTDGSSYAAPNRTNGVALMIPVICANSPCGVGAVANNVVRANVISGNNNDGVHLEGTQAQGNRVAGNFIGTTADGSLPLPNGNAGVVIRLGSGNNVVGGTTPADQNVISGNGTTGNQAKDNSGVLIDAAGIPAYTTANSVLGNYIGIDVTATHAVGNVYAGVLIRNAQGNTIGGGVAGSANVVGGNFYGISVEGQAGQSAAFNTVQGNYVGTSATGAQLPNSLIGVNLFGQTSGNTILSNTARNNGQYDLSDSNLPGSCPNTWQNNTFQTDNEPTPPTGCIN